MIKNSGKKMIAVFGVIFCALRRAAVIFFPLFFILAASAYAKQQQPQHEPGADDIVAKMKVQLELTDKQVEKVRPIINNYLVKEKQLKLEEKRQLGKVLTGGQMFTWNFLQNEKPREKKKKSGL